METTTTITTIARDLKFGAIRFSEAQLVQLLKILVEIEATPLPSGDIVLFDTLRMLRTCKNRLCRLALFTHPEDPTVEARDAITMLRSLALALRKQSKYQQHSLAGKRRHIPSITLAQRAPYQQGDEYNICLNWCNDDNKNISDNVFTFLEYGRRSGKSYKGSFKQFHKMKARQSFASLSGAKSAPSTYSYYKRS